MATFTERLAILIDAKTGGAVRDINRVGDASLELGTKTDRASKVVQRLGVESVVSGAQLKAGLAAGAAAAGFAFAAFAKHAVGAASDLNEQVNRTQVVFGRAADDVLSFGDDAARSLGISNRAALEAAGGFGNMLKALNLGSEPTAALSKGMVQLASDMASFNNLGTDEALEKIRSGLAGEAEPLRTVGVFLTEAAVKSKALELGLGGAHRELTEGEKIQARYALILEQTADQQGDFARTSDSLANQQRTLKAQAEDLSASFGQVLVPAITSVAQAANTLLGPLTAAADVVGGLSVIGEGIGFGLQAAAGPIGLLAGGWSKLTGSQDDAADSAENAAGIYQGLTSILGGTASAAATVSGAFGAVANAVRDIAAAGVEGAEGAQRLNDALRETQDADEAYSDAVESVSDAQEGVRQATEDLAEARSEAARSDEEAADRIVQAMEAVTAANERVEDSYHAIEQAQERATRTAFDLAEQQEEAAKAQRTYDQALADFGPNHHLTVEAAEELSDAREAERRANVDAQEATRSVTEAQEDLARAQRDARTAQDELADAHDRGTEAQDRTREAAENLRDAQETLSDAERDAARAAEDAEQAHRKAEAAQRDEAASAAVLLEEKRRLIEQHPELAAVWADEIVWLERVAGAYDTVNSAIRNVTDAVGRAGTSVLDALTGNTGGADAAGVFSGASGGGTVINVFPAPGQDEEEIGRVIAWRLGG